MTAVDAETRSDDWTRDRVRERLSDNLYLEAGAGTGKTDALVTRLSELLAKNTAKPEEVAAITFTRAAAFEMRSRLRSALEKKLGDETEPEKTSHLAAVVDSLDALAIQTIHSFALSILREQPLEAGLPPVIEPMDDIQAGVEFEEQWTEWFAGRIEEDPDLAPALGIADRLGVRAPADRLRDLARSLEERHHLLRPGMFSCDGVEPPAISTALVSDTLSEARRTVAAAPAPDDKICIFVETVVAPELESLLTLAGDAKELPAADFIGVPSGAKSFRADRTGSQANWSKSPGGAAQLERLRGLLGDLQDEIDRALNALKQSTTATLCTAAADFTLEHAALRRSEGRLTFHDQLVLARDLLGSNPDAKRRLRDRFKFILVDEFQDTDPVQIELLQLLVSDGDTQVRPGSLFIVGDPKQSIYRFRGADPGSSAALSDAVASNGARLQLSENHRSVPGVLKWVNAVFSGWMTEGKANGQARYGGLRWETDLETPEVEAETGGAPVRWFGCEQDGGADDARRLEFKDIAAICAAAGAGGFRVRGKDGAWRDSKFADVAVLVKRRTGIEVLEDQLTGQRIPYVLDSQSPLFTSQDIRDLHACLAAIDDPSNQVAVLGAVRSPAFSCRDSDLMEWKAGGGGFAYLVPDRPTEPACVAEAFAELEKFHRRSRELDTASLVERFIRERRLREKAMLTRSGPERVRKLDMVVELANTLWAGNGMVLRDFTRWLERQADENARMPERISQGVATNAVRVMTIHAAKGLEFPVVIMAAASTSGRGGNGSVQVRTWRDNNAPPRVEVQFGGRGIGLMTDGTVDAIEQDKIESELEDVRLMYVAATRARDHLLLSRYRSNGNRGNKPLIAEIERQLEGQDGLWREWTPPAGLKQRVLEPAAAQDTRQQRDEWHARRKTVIADATRMTYVTPTSLKPETAPAPLSKEPSEQFSDDPVRPGRAATELGRAVHAVLQLIDLAGWSDSELDRLADRMADQHGCREDRQEVARLACAALGTSAMRRAAAAAKLGKAWREVSVAAALPGTHGELEGQIDLVFIEEDGSLTIVDHKTDRERGRTIEESAAPYLLQMGAYAWCTEQVSGLAVERAVLLFARRAGAGSEAEYAVPDLSAVKAEAARMASERVSAAPPAS